MEQASGQHHHARKAWKQCARRRAATSHRHLRMSRFVFRAVPAPTTSTLIRTVFDRIGRAAIDPTYGFAKGQWRIRRPSSHERTCASVKATVPSGAGWKFASTPRRSKMRAS
jgi:hypothetical protein